MNRINLALISRTPHRLMNDGHEDDDGFESRSGQRLILGALSFPGIIILRIPPLLPLPLLIYAIEYTCTHLLIWINYYIQTFTNKYYYLFLL